MSMDVTEILAIGVLALAMLGACGFWIWMLVECLTKEPDAGNTKICWTLVIVFAHVVGAAIYYLVRREKRFAEVGR
jgi:hypothetical protein